MFYCNARVYGPDFHFHHGGYEVRSDRFGAVLPEQLPADFQPQLSFDGLGRTVCDYIAGMTDNYAVGKFTELFVPSGWNVRG